jgi:hypothetical protein
MSWTDWILAGAWVAIFILMLCVAKLAAREDEASERMARDLARFCDYEGCPCIATTIVADENGKIARACGEHFDPVIRRAIDPEFEVMDIAA